MLRKINFRQNTVELRESDVLFFCHDNNRGLNYQGKAYSPIIDSYAEIMQREGLTVQTIANPWSVLGKGEAFGDPVLFNRSYLLARTLDKLLCSNSTKSLYLNILKKVKPSRVITIGCDDYLCAAARELNILHVEILHGFGYDPIPWGWDRKSKDHLPQEIYTFDDTSTETFRVLEEKGVRVKKIKHPFLSRFEGDLIDELPEEWKLKKSSEYSKQILVSLQWGYASGVDCYSEFEGVLDNGLIPNAVIEAISKTTKMDILWRFRFHPVHYRNKKLYKKHFQLVDNLIEKYQNCEWVESTEKPLPSVLHNCNAHITMSSMSSYESAYFGVSTLAFCPTLRNNGLNRNLFNDLVEKKVLKKSDATLPVIEKWLDTVFQYN